MVISEIGGGRTGSGRVGPADPVRAGGDAVALPEVFAVAVAEIRAAGVRGDVVVEEVPPPRRVAPFAIALDGQIDVEAVTRRLARPRPVLGLVATRRTAPDRTPADQRDQRDGDQRDHDGDEDELTSDLADAGGRFVLLYDPACPAEWDGDQRVIALIKAVVEPELLADPMLADIAWAWLSEELLAAGASWIELGGTVTQVSSRSFGALDARPGSVQVELRASWTPTGPAGAHVEAWAAALCRLAGVPPLAPGVVTLASRRG